MIYTHVVYILQIKLAKSQILSFNKLISPIILSLTGSSIKYSEIGPIKKCEMSKFTFYQSDKCFWSKVKELGVAISTSETSVLMNLDIMNDYFVDIDVSRAVRYTSKLRDAPVNYPT